MNNCRGCGTVLDPSEEQVNSAVDQVLETSLRDAHQRGGVCPLCGHSKAASNSNRTLLKLILLLGCLAMGAFLWMRTHDRQTRRMSVAQQAIQQLNANALVTSLLGSPVHLDPGMQGNVTQDETGWQEATVTIPVRGPKDSGLVRVGGGRTQGSWTFSTFEIVVQQQHKKIDLISGRVVEYEPNAYVDLHTLPAGLPESMAASIPTAHLDGTFPCVSAAITPAGELPELGGCSMPLMAGAPVDRFEADLRYGRFVMRQTDLFIKDGFDVPLTRTYTSRELFAPTPDHAFGNNSNHPYDISPLGTRNPYTYQMIVLEDGDSLYFPRVSSGTGYADAVYRHSETSSRYYRATHRWNGNGWTTHLDDGSEIIFPESYSAKNLAQGAPVEMRNGQGERLLLNRDPERNLTEIQTPHGHWIKFTYDQNAHIRRADDDAGDWALYAYNGDGLLSEMVSSSGRRRDYWYQGVRMTRISDETGRTLLQNWYQDNALVKQQFADGEVYQYSYEPSDTGDYYQRAVVTLPDGSLKYIDLTPYLPDQITHRPQ